MIPFSLQPRFSAIVNEQTIAQQLSVSVLRLDELHPEISGNKIFKLDQFIDDAINEEKEFIVTKGGAYSNHLAATAAMAQLINKKAVGMVRGEKPKTLSPTLSACLEKDMEIIFVPRNEYNLINEGNFRSYWPNHAKASFIPEGGYHPAGAVGASKINAFTAGADYIVCAIGTATTFSGLCLGKEKGQEVIGVPVLKGMHDIPARLELLTGIQKLPGFIWPEYHFGGYAKKDDILIDFMNSFWEQYQIPTDFVYTGKLFYAMLDKIRAGFFPPGSKIVAIHSGGLQGNNSLPKGQLNF